MNLNHVNIYFYVRPSTVKNKRGHLNVRVTVNNRQIVASVKSLSMYPKEFDAKTQNPKESCDLYLECQNFMVGIRQEINRIHNEFEKKHFLLTKEHMVKAVEEVYFRVKNGRSSDAKTYMDMFDLFLKEEKETVGILISNGTHKVRKRYKKIAVNTFGESANIPVCNITPEDLKKVQLNLLGQYAKSTSARVWHLFASVFEYTKKKKEITDNPCDEMDCISFEEADPLWLEQDEVASLVALELRGSIVDYRNAFIFCCYTGLCIGDYKLLNSKTQAKQIEVANSPVEIKPGQIVNTPHGDFIIGTRRKSGTMYRIPIMPEVQEILDYYGGIEALPYHLPKTGLALNSLMQMIKCKKIIRFHTARASMANYLINVKMMNPYYVKDVMGWKKIEEAEPYTIVNNSVLAKQLLGVGEIYEPKI